MNTAQQIIKDIQEAREQIMAMCGFTEEQLNELQWNGALDCLRKVLRSDEYGIYELPKTSGFWNWWSEQWYRMDEEFLNSCTWSFEHNSYCIEFKERVIIASPHLNMGDVKCALYKRMVFIETQIELRQAYLKFHKMDEGNPLVNTPRLETSFYNMLSSLK